MIICKTQIFALYRYDGFGKYSNRVMKPSLIFSKTNLGYTVLGYTGSFLRTGTRVSPYMKCSVGKYQGGFREGRSTTDEMF